MEARVGKLELNVEALLDADLHFNGQVFLFFFAHILNQKLFFLGNSIVVAINDHVDEVAQPHHNAIVTFKLLFDSIEGKVVGHVIFELPWGFQVSDQLQKDGVLVLIVQVFDEADQFDANPQMIQLFALVQIDHHLPLYIFSVLEDGCFVGGTTSILYRHILATLHLLQLHINFAGRTHSKQRTKHFLLIDFVCFCL